MKILKRILYTILFVVVVLVAGVIYLAISSSKNGDGVADTKIEIRDVRPTGKLYVLSAYIEDYKLDSVWESTTVSKIANFFGSESKGDRHFRLMSKIVDAKYYVNLDSLNVTFSADGKTAYIEKPEVHPHYGNVVDPQESKRYICDDDDYWDAKYKNDYGNGLAAELQKQIKAKFETEANRKKAQDAACDRIKQLYEALGFNVEIK